MLRDQFQTRARRRLRLPGRREPDPGHDRARLRRDGPGLAVPHRRGPARRPGRRRPRGPCDELAGIQLHHPPQGRRDPPSRPPEPGRGDHRRRQLRDQPTTASSSATTPTARASSSRWPTSTAIKGLHAVVLGAGGPPGHRRRAGPGPRRIITIVNRLDRPRPGPARD